MGQLDLDWNKSLKEISVTTEIKQKDIDDFLKAIFGDKEQGKLETIIAKIAINFLPKKDAVEKQLKDVSGKHPLQPATLAVTFSQLPPRDDLCQLQK